MVRARPAGSQSVDKGPCAHRRRARGLRARPRTRSQYEPEGVEEAWLDELSTQKRRDPPKRVPFALILRFASFATDRKSTRLNSSHRCISYAVFCLKKKKTK